MNAPALLSPLVLAMLLTFLGGQATVSAQALTLTGTNYFQNFNGIGAGLPTGWTVWDDATSTSLGTQQTFNPATAAWRLATAGVFHNMAATDNTNWNTLLPFTQDEDAATQAAATNRAPGIRLLSSYDPGAAFVLRIENTLGFTNFVFSVDLMMMTTNARRGQWTIDCAVGNPPVSFTPLGTLGDLTLDATNVLNDGAFGKTNGTFALPASVCNRNENLWIRVALLTATGPTGARDTYGIDNAALSWSVIPPSSNPPVIHQPPQSRTNLAGTVAIFSVEAAGSGTLFYQWRKGANNLVNGGNISGANSPILTLSNVVAADAGNYSVLITNQFGSTSAVATLTVTDPAILSPPASRTNVLGDVAKFTALSAGTLPLSYAWRFNGAPIPGAAGVLTNWANQTLTLVNVQFTNQGDYTMVVSNSVGVVTSAVAKLTLLPTPATRIARWAFNSDPPDNDTTTGVTAPEIGTGTASTIGGAFGAFLVGSGSDPATLGTDNSGWNIKGYPPAGNANKTAGVQFEASTVNWQDLVVTWEQQNNSRASRYVRLQYTTNGADFVDHDVFDLSGRQGEWVLLASSLAGLPNVNHNPNFAFRIVAEFESTAAGTTNADYVATDPTQLYGSTAGAIRYDVVNLFANPLGTVAPVTLTRVEVSGGLVRIDFTAGAADVPGNFRLQSAPAVNSTYGDVSATITQTGPGRFRAERALEGAQRFYRIRR